MRKKSKAIPNWLIKVGFTCALLCLLGAACYVGQSIFYDFRAGVSSEELAQKVEEQTATEFSAATYPVVSEMPMPTVDIEGATFVGVLRIPSLNLELAVQSSANDFELRTSPGVYAGSAYSSDMIIAGMNYDAHFGRLAELAVGDTITFTDLDANEFTYIVASFEQLDINATVSDIVPDGNSSATDDSNEDDKTSDSNTTEALSSSYPLILITQSEGGQSNLVLRCHESATNSVS